VVVVSKVYGGCVGERVFLLLGFDFLPI